LLLFALPAAGACAPLATLRPASGVPSAHHMELGAAAVRLGPRPYVDEEAEDTGQVWYTLEPSRHFALSALAAFDEQAAAGGLAARWNAIRSSRFAFGPEVEAGYAWGAGALSAALRTVGQNWIYAAPRLYNIGFEWTFGAPVGVSVDCTHGFVLRGEVQVSWADFVYYNRRIHLAAGLVYQF
jgi:hypothetical protein